MSEQGGTRSVLHVDMDAFYVSVELLHRPELVGREVIVGHRGERSVVLSASYECRRLGVRSAMPMLHAVRLAPRAVVIEPQMASYREYSGRIMEIFREITPLVEQVSVDEAFLDVSGSIRRLGQPGDIAAMIKRRIRAELGLPASVGIARNKFVAKVASTRAKPDGLLVVPAEDTVAFLHTLPVGALWGVGAKTREILEGAGISSVAELAGTPVRTLQRMLGVQGLHLHELAWGRDDRAVEPVRQEKSIGAEETFATDTTDGDTIGRELLRLSHRVAERLRASGKSAGTVVLKLRYADFSTVTRSRKLAQPVDSGSALHQVAEELLAALGPRPQAVRLVGVRAERLAEGDSGVQLSIDASEDNWRHAEATMDRIRSRFPAGAVRPAALIERPGDAVIESPADYRPTVNRDYP